MSEASGPPLHVETSRAGPTSVLVNARRVLQRRETIWLLVSGNLRAGHRDKVLGNIWNLLDPLLFIGVYFLVFGVGLRQSGDDPMAFVLYMAVGVLAYNFLQGTLAQAASCVRANSGILHSVAFPKAILPISLSFSRLYDFAWGLLVLLAIVFAMQIPISWAMAWLPAIVVVQWLLCLGLAFWVAHLGAFFADTVNVVGVLTRLLFFGSPIFYYARSQEGHEGIVPERYLAIYYSNPLACLMEAYRDAILWQRSPRLEELLYVAAISGVSLLLGFTIFSRAEGRFAKYV
ncbi:ABC transporter permease [Myxococcota bacterium]|nr:ABC transporter permease [Myxococcota bacterium]